MHAAPAYACSPTLCMQPQPMHAAPAYACSPSLCMQPHPMHAAPPWSNLHWFPLTVAKNIWPKLVQAASQNDLQFILTADGWM